MKSNIKQIEDKKVTCLFKYRTLQDYKKKINNPLKHFLIKTKEKQKQNIKSIYGKQN